METELHEPYELRMMDLSLLQGKIIKVENSTMFTCSIGNPKFKFKIHPYKDYRIDRLRMVMKYRLFTYLMEQGEIKYCDCGNLIFDNRKYVDICEKCLKEKI